MDVSLIFWSISILLGAITAYLTYRQITIRRTLSAAEEYIKIHDKITVLGSREKTVELLSEIVDRAENGDILFGHCRICTGYPQKFFTSLSTAVARGVKFQAVIVEKPESREFIDFLLGLDPRYVEVKKPKSEIYSSVFGIRGKEVLICYHMIDRSIGIHFKDSVTTKYIEIAFDKIWEEAERIGR